MRGKVARPFAVEDAQQLYLELGSSDRVASVLGVAKKRVLEAVKPLVPEVRRMTRASALILAHSEAIQRNKLAGVQWWCDCGCKATGEQCFNGHSAPWAA